ncbi:hypothetical protein FRB90_004668 [Tulasnella sp. 427]|nr:hypothetical protein FRB90_004668 [Tulasnella sp. 427]
MSDQTPESDTFQVTLHYLINQQKVFQVSSSDTVASLKDAIEAETGIQRPQLRLVFGRMPLTDDKTLAEFGIGPNSVLRISPALRKPVVYLYPPKPTQVNVKLSLIPEWRFSVLYPSASVEEVKHNVGAACYAQQTEWNVLARPDGTMTVLSGAQAGTDVSYLFWEAQIADQAMELPDSPPVSRPSTPTTGYRLIRRELAFIPGKTTCSPSDSVLVESKDAPAYLNKALETLGLHTEARTSFITFWLPDMLRHRFIALKFIPQTFFERAAPLDITPRPDVVTRIFMLFQGVNTSDTALWKEAESRASESPDLWREVVGIETKQSEDGMFRVVEWGGMEVL